LGRCAFPGTHRMKRSIRQDAPFFFDLAVIVVYTSISTVNKGADMLAAFFETFMWTFAIFVLAEIALRAIGITVHEESQEEKLVQEFEDAIVLCKVEQLGDVFYLYNTQDDTFVGQARSINEFTQLSEHLQKHLMIVDGDDEVVNQLKKVTSEISISK